MLFYKILNKQNRNTRPSQTHLYLSKSTYANGKPKSVYYRCFKNFDKELLKEESLRKNLSKNLKNIGISFEAFYDTFSNILDCYLLPPFEK